MPKRKAVEAAEAASSAPDESSTTGAEQAVRVTVYAPTGYELWGMVHLRTGTKGGKRSGKAELTKWSCGLEHEVEGVERGKFSSRGYAGARRGWPGGNVLHVETVPTAEAGRRIMQRVVARLPAACSAHLSENMRRWEDERGNHAKTCEEGPRLLDGGTTCKCKDSIGYHGSYQMPSFTRGGRYAPAPRGAVLTQRGENARTAGKEVKRLVKEAASEERAGANEK